MAPIPKPPSEIKRLDVARIAVIEHRGRDAGPPRPLFWWLRPWRYWKR
jgi:hypothetical protein